MFKVKKNSRKRSSRRLLHEPLEDRTLFCVGTSICVDSPDDSGPGTLRDAVENAPAGAEILFHDNVDAVDLNSRILINKPLTIDGAADDRESVTIQVVGQNQRAFSVTDGSSLSDDSVFFSNLVVTGGNFTSAGSGGGGIFNTEDLTLDHVDVVGNSVAGSGGGILSKDGKLRVNFSEIANNTAGGNGGGIAVVDNGYAYVSDSTLVDNLAGNNGGGAFFSEPTGNAPDFHFTQVTASGNSASKGGGIYLEVTGGATRQSVSNATSIVRSTVTANTASIVGSGVYYAGYSNGLLNTLTASIVSDNNGAADLHQLGSVKSGANLIGSYSSIGFNEQSTLPPSLLNTNANLHPLAENGGPTRTHLPQPSSLAIDRYDTQTSSTDQRGFSRSSQENWDVGSVELQAPGDLDGDGNWDCDDINALSTAIVEGSSSTRFDLNDDGVLDIQDVEEWLAIAGAQNLASGNPYLNGDANLDGTVDGVDILIWNDHKFTYNSNWCDGDFNADGIVDGLDFLIWNDNKFMSSNITAGGDVKFESGANGDASGGNNRLVGLAAEHAIAGTGDLYTPLQTRVDSPRQESPLHIDRVASVDSVFEQQEDEAVLLTTDWGLFG